MDSDTYKVPGNYYCSNNSIAESLINSPVYNAFILKVDYSNGHIYPRQTFCNYTNDIITSRTWDPYANKWGKFHQIALKSDLLKINVSRSTDYTSMQWYINDTDFYEYIFTAIEVVYRKNIGGVETVIWRK